MSNQHDQLEPESEQPDSASNKWQRIEEETAEQEAQQAAERVQSVEEGVQGLSLEQQVESLKGKLSSVQSQLDDEKDRAIRVMAEMDNLRRRTERDIESARKFAVEKLLRALLPVIDSLDRGLQAMVGEDPSTTAAREGLEMTRDVMLKTLSSHGIELIAPAIGDQFNAEFHEAVMMRAEEGVAGNSIVEVFQPGYLLNERLVRAASVIVTPKE